MREEGGTALKAPFARKRPRGYVGKSSLQALPPEGLSTQGLTYVERSSLQALPPEGLSSQSLNFVEKDSLQVSPPEGLRSRGLGYPSADLTDLPRSDMQSSLRGANVDLKELHRVDAQTHNSNRMHESSWSLAADVPTPNDKLSNTGCKAAGPSSPGRLNAEPMSTWRSAASAAVGSRTPRQRLSMFVQLTSEPTTKALPRLETERFEPSIRQLSQYESFCVKHKILPKFVKKLQQCMEDGNFNLRGSGLGSEQLAALLKDSQLVPTMQIRRWQMRDMRLGDKGVALFAEALAQDVEAVDLASNDIGPKGMHHLGNAMLTRPLTSLQDIDLSFNNLGDACIMALVQGLEHCSHLTKMDLSRNVIKDGASLGRLLATHKQLNCISVRRNQLTGFGIAAIFEGALENVRMGGQVADMDVGWNCVATEGMWAAEAIAPVFRESASLYHCDLSYCGFDISCCEVLGQSLRDNHSLYGLHIVGNAATVDADGFVTAFDISDASSLVQEEASLSAPSSLVFGGAQPGPQNLLGWSDVAFLPDALDSREVCEQKTQCWACEGWFRQEIVWPYNPKAPATAVWAFTSMDCFRHGLRLRLEKGSAGGRFVGARMVPPAYRLQVIFQVDSELRLLPDQKCETLSPPAEVTLKMCEELPELSLDAHQEVLREDPATLAPVVQASKATLLVCRRSRDATDAGVSPGGLRGVVVNGPHCSAPLLMPRITETEFKSRKKISRGPPFWKPFKRETSAMWIPALEADWDRCRLAHMIGNYEIEEVKQTVQEHYGLLMAIYRHYSSLDVSGVTGFGITQLQACELMVDLGIVDGRTTKMADIDRLFIAAKVTLAEIKKTLQVVNDKSMVRYEFLEFVLRLAQQRFLKSGEADTINEAVCLAIQMLEPEGKRLVQTIENFFDFFWTEHFDNVIKDHSELLEAVYQHYHGSKTLPGRTKFMHVSEFQMLLDRLDPSELGFQLRYSALAFRMGMMVQTDESGASRFQEMTRLEFYHALGACVFLAQPEGTVPDSQDGASSLDRLLREKMPGVLRASSKQASERR